MRHMYIPKLFIIAFLLNLTLFSQSVYATANVINDISISVNTGGNKVNENSTVIGTSTSSVDIKTTVNGKTVEEIHKTSTENNVEVKHAIKVNNVGATTSTKIDFSSAKNKSDSRINKSTTTNLSTIINNKGEKSLNQNNENKSFFGQIIFTFSKTFAYVLSNFFTFPWAAK